MGLQGSSLRALKWTRSRRFAGPTIILAIVLLVPTTLLFVSNADAAPSAVPLGTASGFGVLAGAGITNTGPTTVTGDIGTYPTTTITGTGSMTVNGANQGGGVRTQQAKTDLVTAYNNAAGQGPTSPIVSDLGGQTLAPGVYNSASSLGLTGTLTLNGGGDASAVFVFQAGSTLTTASASQVVLINGAQACNVFWQVGSSTTLGTGSTFLGTVLAAQSITVTTGVTIGGRVLARNGAVTLDTDTITVPSCSAPTTTVASATSTSGATATTVPSAPTVASLAAKRAVAKAKAAKVAARKAALAKKAAAKKPVSFAKPPVGQPGFTG
jgi:hypothetical protein